MCVYVGVGGWMWVCYLVYKWAVKVKIEETVNYWADKVFETLITNHLTLRCAVLNIVALCFPPKKKKKVPEAFCVCVCVGIVQPFLGSTFWCWVLICFVPLSVMEASRDADNGPIGEVILYVLEWGGPPQLVMSMSCLMCETPAEASPLMEGLWCIHVIDRRDRSDVN